jgi:hypothetical protein
VKATERLSKDLSLPQEGVAAVVRLLSEGATVPFIARYRKEATGGLDEVQIRAIEEHHAYLTDLEARRETVLAEISEQGKLTDELARSRPVAPKPSSRTSISPSSPNAAPAPLSRESAVSSRSPSKCGPRRRLPHLGKRPGLS